MISNAPSILRLMPPNHTQQPIPIQKITNGLVREIIRTPPRMIMHKRRTRRDSLSAIVRLLLVAVVPDRVGPEQIAEEAEVGRFHASVDLYRRLVRISIVDYGMVWYMNSCLVYRLCSRISSIIKDLNNGSIL